MCVRSRAVESWPALCERVCVCVTSLTRFSAYHFGSSYKNIGLHVLIDFAAFHAFSVDSSAQRVKSLDPNLQEIIMCGKNGLVEMSYEAGNLYCQAFFKDYFLKETRYSPHFTRGEALLSDPHHRCWRWMSSLCEV